MIIIEFCGTPGCGKTTLCDELEKKLIGLGFNVKNLQKHQKSDTLLKKIKKIISIIKYKHCKENRILKKYLYSDCLKGVELAKKRGWANRILEANWLVSKHSEIDYGLFDEGAIQFLTSFYGSSIKEGDKKVFSEVSNMFYKNKYFVFLCEIDIEQNVERLIMRGRNNEWLPEKCSDIRGKLMDKYSLIKESIKLTNTDYCLLDMSNDTEVLVDKCIDYLGLKK